MKTIKQLAVPQDTDLTKFPQGTIKNQTDSEKGTPVVREVYGDILTNMYALLADTGIVPDGLEDSSVKGYQLLEAIKKVVNVLNDIEQVVTLTGTQWSVGFNIDNLPNKYVFIGRATEDYNPAVAYSFGGTGIDTYSFVSPTGFMASDEVLIVIDFSGVRAIGLNRPESESDVFTVFGTPVMFNDSSKMYYEEDGNLLTDLPSINYLQQIIRVAESNGTILVYNMMVLQGHILCFCFLPDTITYKFFQFDINDLSIREPVAISGIAIPVGNDNAPYVYTDGTVVYLTNQAGTTANEYELAGLTYDPDVQTLTLTVIRELAGSFTKTTNGVVQGTDLVTFIAGELKKFDLTTGVETYLGEYNSLLGILFRMNGNTYYSNGEVAKKWIV